MRSKKWQWLVVMAGLLIAARQGVSVWRLYKSGEQVRLAAEQLRQEEEKNKQLKQRLAEVDNPQFVEKEAREKLGYVKEGETIVILSDEEPESRRVEELEKPNWQQWWDLYIRI